MLLECAADVEATDADNNTALHLIVSTAVASQESELSEQARQEMETMIDALLKAGSHADAVNREGVTATHDLSNWWPEFRINNHVSLKCLCARAVRKYGLKYVGEVPTALYAFIEKH